MNREFVFPARLAADPEDGGFVVTFPDLPEIITQADTADGALAAVGPMVARWWAGGAAAEASARGDIARTLARAAAPAVTPLSLIHI